MAVLSLLVRVVTSEDLHPGWGWARAATAGFAVCVAVPFALLVSQNMFEDDENSGRVTMIIIIIIIIIINTIVLVVVMITVLSAATDGLCITKSLPYHGKPSTTFCWC
jgi:hypothetical protein